MAKVDHRESGIPYPTSDKRYSRAYYMINTKGMTVEEVIRNLGHPEAKNTSVIQKHPKDPKEKPESTQTVLDETVMALKARVHQLEAQIEQDQADRVKCKLARDSFLLEINRKVTDSLNSPETPLKCHLINQEGIDIGDALFDVSDMLRNMVMIQSAMKESLGRIADVLEKVA